MVQNIDDTSCSKISTRLFCHIKSVKMGKKTPWKFTFISVTKNGSHKTNGMFLCFLTDQ